MNVISYLIMLYFTLFWFTEIMGGTDTPYDGGLFSLEIKVPERYTPYLISAFVHFLFLSSPPLLSSESLPPQM